jgi:hypothetical protein
MPSRVARAYSRSLKYLGSLVHLQQAIFAGIWLGLLSRDSLYEIDKVYYDRERKYHEDAWNLGGLFVWEAKALEQYFGDRNPVIVAAAGGGREIIALQKRGIDVDGFECHSGLVDLANRLQEEQGLTKSVRFAPRDECPVFDREYNGAIVGWSGYMLIQSRARRVNFLKQLRAGMKIGSPVLLSFYHRSNDERALKVVAAIGNALRLLRRRERLELGDDLHPNYVHFFSRDEIDLELRAGGFRLEQFSTEGYGHAIAFADGSDDASTAS